MAIDIFSSDNAMKVARLDTMEKARGKGASCPCCGQFVKVYRRTINSTMARQLIAAYQRHGAGNWFHTRDVVLTDTAGAGDFSKMEYWGLIARDMAHVQGDDGKRTSGMWKITQIGAEFIEGKALVAQYAFVYNGQLLELAGPMVSIQTALGNQFDYRHIMGWTAAPQMYGKGL